MNDDLIDRRAAIDAVRELYIQSPKINNDIVYDMAIDQAHDALVNLPSAQPQYEELTPEEAASEIASGSTMSAWYWLDAMIRLKQMGYVICRKR